MRDRLLSLVRSVTNRRRTQLVTERVIAGILYAGIGVILLAILSLTCPGALLPFPSLITLGALLAGGVLGGATGYLTPLDLRESARLIDRSYQLKSRVLTAFENREKITEENDPEGGKISEKASKGTTGGESMESLMTLLQFEDASRWIETVDPKVVVPSRLPEKTELALTIALASLLIAFLLPSSPPIPSDPAPVIPSVELTELTKEIGEELAPTLEKLTEWSKQYPEDSSLPTLHDRLEKRLSEWSSSESDPQNALATLSRMEADVTEAIRATDPTSITEALQTLADSLRGTESTAPIGDALLQAEDAPSPDPESIASNLLSNETGDRERRELADRLVETSRTLRRIGQMELAEDSTRLADALAGHHPSELSEAIDRLLQSSRRLADQRELAESLADQLPLFSLYKSRVFESVRHQNGGDGRESTQTPGRNWGTGTAEKPLSGETVNHAPPSTDSAPPVLDLSGTVGDGPSAWETITTAPPTSPEGVATRSRQEIWIDYRRRSEEALRSDPIPIGTRRMIRRYFESIRPPMENQTEGAD